MTSYPNYKESGVNWLGKIPNSWNTKMLKYVFNPISEKSETGEEELLSVLIQKGVVRRKDFLDDDSEHMSRSKSLVGYLKCSKGNLVNNIMKMGFCCLGISPYDGIVSPSYSVFEIDKNSFQDYYDYLLKTELYIGQYRIRSKGIQDSRMRLYDDYFLSIHTHIPPLSEQTQIVSFLDTKTQKVDELIDKTEKKIELLKEIRTSLINHYVTKGLNPNVEMKDSGVEWIGEIPSYWKVLNGSYIGSYSKGKGIKKDEVVEVGHPCVRYGEIYTKYELMIDSTISFISDETTSNSVSVKTGTLLLTGSGETKEEIGKCIVYLGDEILWVGGDIIVIRPTEQIDSLFLSYLINSECIRVQREMSSKGEIVVHIYSKNFKEMKYPIPPLSEQTQIVEYLDEQTQKIDTTIEKETQRTELLKEYRQSLISEVVTGKVDVRDYNG